MQKTLKSIIVSTLAWQLKRLRKKHTFKVVAVVGSVGKTSTKLAIARVLDASWRVRYQDGNYNDIVSVPLIFFGQSLPSLRNPFAWLNVFIKNETQISKDYPYDVIVVELGTDKPGQISAFQQYIHADIAVVSAITPEHMENFDSLEAVAAEELAVALYSDTLLINSDMCPDALTQPISGKFLSYAIHRDATYLMDDIAYGTGSTTFVIKKDRTQLLQAHHASFSEPQLYALLAAVAVSDLLQGTPANITTGIDNVTPVPGRMQLLSGIKQSKLIDDTYNASPEAVKAALATLYRIPAPQKIALLGNMNELGAISEHAHSEIGAMCDPTQLALVVTLGTDSNQYLATSAEKNGCKVVRAQSPQEAGIAIADALQDGALVLFKGSQNGVFAEEAIKLLLLNEADEAKLVRQSPSWLKLKDKQFTTATGKK